MGKTVPIQISFPGLLSIVKILFLQLKLFQQNTLTAT